MGCHLSSFFSARTYKHTFSHNYYINNIFIGYLLLNPSIPHSCSKYIIFSSNDISFIKSYCSPYISSSSLNLVSNIIYNYYFFNNSLTNFNYLSFISIFCNSLLPSDIQHIILNYIDLSSFHSQFNFFNLANNTIIKPFFIDVNNIPFNFQIKKIFHSPQFFHYNFIRFLIYLIWFDYNNNSVIVFNNLKFTSINYTFIINHHIVNFTFKFNKLLQLVGIYTVHSLNLSLIDHGFVKLNFNRSSKSSLSSLEHDINVLIY